MSPASSGPRCPFTDALRQELESKLGSFERHKADAADLRRAAVALVILPDADGEACVLLTQRAFHLSKHAGQYALPGGRIDAGETTVEAALREAHEEVGLRLDTERVLGRLDDFVTKSGFHMGAVAVWGDPDETIVPSPDEVAEAHLVPLAQLADPKTLHLIDGEPGQAPVLSLAIVETLVFAPTAAIMLQLAKLAVDGVVERVHHYEQPRFAWK